MLTPPSPGSAENRPTVPMLNLGLTRTPVHPLPGLMREFDSSPALLVKREDLCGVGPGGSERRKLQALLADAVRRRASVVVTLGAIESNHCAMTAVLAAMCGLRSELLLRGDDPGHRSGNLGVAEGVGANLRFLGDVDAAAVEEAVTDRVAMLTADGEAPYPIPLGGSTPLGAAACAMLVRELAAQLAHLQPTHLVVAAGSLGTLAGLVAGVWANGLDWQVDGYTVLWPQNDAHERLRALLDATHRQYFPTTLRRGNYTIDGSQLGAGYQQTTSAASEAIQLAARHDGLLLDAMHTGKAFAGLIAGIRSGRYDRSHRIVFVHTGGVLGLRATADPYSFTPRSIAPAHRYDIKSAMR